MTGNTKPGNKLEDVEQPASNPEHDQELDEAALDQIAGGTTMQQYFQMLSNILKSQSDTVKKIADNLR